MSQAQRMRREYLVEVCRTIAAYIEEGRPVRLRTVTLDAESESDLAAQWRGQMVILFAIEDGEAFRELLEPGENPSSTEAAC